MLCLLHVNDEMESTMRGNEKARKLNCLKPLIEVKISTYFPLPLFCTCKEIFDYA